MRNPISSRPLSRAQQLENAAFLKALRRTGNVRLAARETGLKYGTVQHRRAKHPAFALRWDAALAFAWARFAADGVRGPVGGKGAAPSLATVGGDLPAPSTTASRRSPSSSRGGAHALRTVGGEPVIVRRNDGKLQMRAAQPGKLTVQCEQVFLAALSATANVRLSAAAAGADVAAFYRRRRQHAGFAREWRLALEMGYERLEMTLLAGWSIEGHEHDAWRHNDPPPIPPMTANQALQLMYLHQKEARLGGTPEPLRRRAGETREAQSMRLSLLYEARMEREREKFRVAEAERRARSERTRIDWESEGVILPDLAQVTGWSTADRTKAPADAGRALFGGWRLEDIPDDKRRR